MNTIETFANTNSAEYTDLSYRPSIQAPLATSVAVTAVAAVLFVAGIASDAVQRSTEVAVDNDALNGGMSVDDLLAQRAAAVSV